MLSGLSEPDGYPLGEEEIEARAQVLWNEFLKIYFGGNPFETPAAGGGTESKTFIHCDLLFDRATPGSQVERPLIHLLLADRRRTRETNLPGGLACHEEAWTWNALVRTPAQAPVESNAEMKDAAMNEADRINRRVAGQLDWLIRSAEGQSLALKGFSRLAVPGPPRMIPSGSWCMRQLVITATVRVRIATNPPA